MDLKYILARALAITRRHKRLWWYGALAGLGTMGAWLGLGVARWDLALGGAPDDPTAAVVVVLLALVVSIFLALLGALARAALVDQVQAAEDRGAVSVGDGWRAGDRAVGPVFGVRALLWLPSAGVALAGGLPVIVLYYVAISQEQAGMVAVGAVGIEAALLVCFAPAVLAAVLISIPLGVLQRLAVRACVLEGRGVQTGIAAARMMQRHHRGPLALIWLVLLAVRGGLLLVGGLPAALLVASLLTGSLLAALASPELATALALAVEVVVWLGGLFAAGVLETYASAAWTLAYRDLTGLGLTGEEFDLTP